MESTNLFVLTRAQLFYIFYFFYVFIRPPPGADANGRRSHIVLTRYVMSSCKAGESSTGVGQRTLVPRTIGGRFGTDTSPRNADRLSSTLM